MRSLTKVALLAGLAIAAAGAYSYYYSTPGVAQGHDATELIAIAPGEFSFYPAGDYLRDGNPVSPRPVVVRFPHELHIMKRQVSQAEYAECVKAKACRVLDKSQRGAVSPDLPVVGISWRDATDYAAWLTARTGRHYRLPTYAEWVYAAGEAYEEDIIKDTSDPNDPAQRWLAEYALETQRKATGDAAPKVFGSFGANKSGMQDMGGNVWDWTDTCHTRQHVAPDGASATPLGENCGVRVVAGSHRSYISDFIRDPKGGACSVGVPPSNLGLRLVRGAKADTAGIGAALRDRLGIL
ncbi:MAG TPA: SUMF1/EgtB/PvdO family nonheme iron enzyme [Candidimonas sp.]|nr:SUMF1/EgtB/PvdO family nonheme iron enzyme [Candidimonas sp.]